VLPPAVVLGLQFGCTEMVMRGKHEGAQLHGGTLPQDLGSGGYRDPQSARIILLMGAPGSGKGTQSSLLESQFGFICISTGAMLRQEARQNTPASFRLRQIMASGELVDDATVCTAVASQIRSLATQPNGTSANLILDGFPRRVEQAMCLDQLLAEMGMPGPLVLHLDVPQDVLLSRLSRRRQCAVCGAIYSLASGASVAGLSAGGRRCRIDGGALVERDDDSEGVVERRLVAYSASTLPVLDYYRKRDYVSGVYRRLDGNRSAAEIAKEVRDIVLFADTAVAA
jgi:adenylate kinase